ncbi:MAG: DEAD/DEAH box helicase [Treponema sp.]|nr:DEAD/DEAH box helicase [Treponema sp.]
MNLSYDIVAMPLPFHPLVASWFTESYGNPTVVQEKAWPLIADGKDVLAIAPTGSGKTLTAFLAALSWFAGGGWDPEQLTVLYVSPLKALNEDIRRNLVEPIEALKDRAAAENDPASPVFRIRVETRSGDTPPAQRRRFLIHPPSILAVTPESLAILLLNPRGRKILSQVRYLVIDEIHAVMGTKRGAFLSCQIDRLLKITGKHGGHFQRIALSATVNPPEMAAEFAGGLNKLLIVAPPAEKKIRFSVEFPSGMENPNNEKLAGDRYGPRYAVLVNHILERIRVLRRNEDCRRTMLVFTGSRRRAERIAYLLNETAGERLALCHHGSLSREVRLEVEQCLVRGLIPCVVATSSLELGIDIGEVEEVILAGTPSSCAQTLQRIGRSGHGAGEESRGILIPFHGMDLLMGAVMAGSVADREIEKKHPVKNPLDILSQMILALCAEQPQTGEELYGIIRSFSVFSGLARTSFNQVIAMLTGKYFPSVQEAGERAENTGTKNAGLRLRDLRSRLYQDIDGKLHAAEGTLGLLYSSGGAIPSRGLYSLRLPDGTKIGELDEEFVFERRNGDSFDFGARSWKILEIGNEAVIVNSQNEAADFQPFWKADSVFRSAELCLRTLDFFSAHNAGTVFPNRDLLGTEAAQTLEHFLFQQRESQGGIPLPDHKNIPVEIINDPALRPDAYQIVFHSFRGGALNYPLSMALSSIIEEKTGMRCEAIPDDNAVLLQLPRLAAETYSGRPDPITLIKDCIASLGSAGERQFRKRLEASGIFGAAFREAAERSMILPRGSFGRRIPLWVMRLRAKRLYDRVASFGDFPAITEAWRTCLVDHFDMEGFRTLLEEISHGTVKLHFFQNAGASPFARNLSWKETNNFMYEYDERKDLSGMAGGGVSDRAIADALSDPSLRPVIKNSTVDSFCARQRRELPGYAPENVQCLSQWVKDRIAIPSEEWKTLVTALPPFLQEQLASDPSLGGRIRTLTFPGAALSVVIHTEDAVSAEEGLLDRLGEWLRFEGPILPEKITSIFGCSAAEAEGVLNVLVETGEIVGKVSVEGIGENGYCDAENYELLLRLTRKRTRPQIKERPASLLVPFIALRQGLFGNAELINPAGDPVLSPIHSLSCYPAPVRLWETEIFPARDPQYGPEKLDSVLNEGRFIWFGAGRERTAFAASEELELADFSLSSELSSDLISLISETCTVYRNFWELKETLENRWKKNLSNAEITGALWEAVWQGRLSSDTWETIRRGISHSFYPEKNTEISPAASAAFSKLPGIVPPYQRTHKHSLVRLPPALRDRWREGAPVPGRMFSLEGDVSADNSISELSALERETWNCARVRLLCRRWGILCRPLLEIETLFSWSELLPAMRRMELSGELVTGRFFEGIPSLQFASPAIAEELEAAEAAAGNAPVYWVNAADPASPAGWNIEGLDSRLPARTPSSRLCFRGKDLAALSGKSGKELELFIEPNDPDIKGILAFFSLPRTRICHPVKKISLEAINGKPAAESPYAACLTEMGFIGDRGKLLLW